MQDLFNQYLEVVKAYQAIKVSDDTPEPIKSELIATYNRLHETMEKIEAYAEAQGQYTNLMLFTASNI